MEHHRFLVHTNHRFPLTQWLFIAAKMSSMRWMYSSSSSATHHIFFPPRLEVVALEQDPNRFLSQPRNQFAFHHFFGQQAYRPARSGPSGRRATRQRHDALPMLRASSRAAFPAVAPLVQRPVPSRLADSVGWSAIRFSGVNATFFATWRMG